MLESMTGSARIQAKAPGIHFEIFIKSINHKYLDVSLRLPPVLRGYEPEFTDIIKGHIARGRVEVELNGEIHGQKPVFDRKIIDSYVKEIMSIGGANFKLDGQTAVRLLTLPGIVSFQEDRKSLPLKQITASLEASVKKLKIARKKEGSQIEKLFRGYLKEIQSHAKVIRKLYDGGRKEIIKKFQNEILGSGRKGELKTGGDWTGPVIEWYDRSDIAEELERIGMHVKAMNQLMTDGVDAGRKLEFFSQELHREINTIGAKSRDFDIRSRVVEMKNLVDKMKEQVRNIC